MLAVGGLAVLAVAALPLPRSGPSGGHLIAATVSLVALALWPALGWRRGPGVPWTLRPTVSAARPPLPCCSGWSVRRARSARPTCYADATVGLPERVVAGLQSPWPLVVTILPGRHGKPMN